MDSIVKYSDDVYRIDVDYIRPMLACCYLLVENGHAALIDCGTSHSLPLVQEALIQAGITADKVDYIIPTHVHLDHAGGAGVMMEAFPNARLVVHPSGAKHLIQPDRLVASATSVYGKDQFQKLFGAILPIDKQRVITPANDESLPLQARTLQFLHTPGHARHHFCIYDSTYNNCFTGDTFGISYPNIKLSDKDKRFLLPTTTPTQFEPDAWVETLQRLKSLPIDRIYLTHFGPIGNIQQNAEYLQKMLSKYAEIGRSALTVEKEDRENVLCKALTGLTRTELENHGAIDVDNALQLLEMDLRLNAQGMTYWLQRLQ